MNIDENLKMGDNCRKFRDGPTKLQISQLLSILIIIIIISIFKEDNVFCMIARLPYGPPVNTNIDYYWTFFRLLLFCECCIVSCAIFVKRKVSACLIILSTKQCSHWYHFNVFGMVRPGFKQTTIRSRSGCSTSEPRAPVLEYYSWYQINAKTYYFYLMVRQEKYLLENS